MYCFHLHPFPAVSLHHIIIYLFSQLMWKPVLCKLYIVVKYIFLPQCCCKFFLCWNAFFIMVFFPKISSFRIASSSSNNFFWHTAILETFFIILLQIHVVWKRPLSSLESFFFLPFGKLLILEAVLFQLRVSGNHIVDYQYSGIDSCITELSV